MRRVTVVFLSGLLLAAMVSAGPSAAASVAVRLEVGNTNPAVGDTIQVELVVDLSASVERLGAYEATLTWEPSLLNLAAVRDGSTAAFAPPLTQAASGSLQLSQSSATGAGGVISLAKARFVTTGTAGQQGSLAVAFAAMTSLGGGASLLGGVTMPSLTLTVAPPRPNTGGGIGAAACDFNDDGRVGLADFFLFGDAFGGASATFDLDRSGRVDLADFFLFADFFGAIVPVAVTPPVANAGPDQQVVAGATVQLNGSASQAAAGGLLSYAWKAPASTPLSDTTAAQPTFAAAVAGVYRFALVVVEGGVRSVADTVVVTVTAPTGPGSFTMAQTLSDQAQLMTIAFDGLAYLSGSLGADSFFPPGKVADFWGFQYLRDNDPSEMGHNTDFLTTASLNMLSILDADQMAQLIALARGQLTSIDDYGYQRFVLMTAFRRLLTGDLPAGTTQLSATAVEAFSAELYRLDGRICLQRAVVMGNILYHLSDAQRAYLDAMVGQGMTSWPVVAEPQSLRPLTQAEKIAVMTYAGDLFSWYAGSLEADVYFCPERQGTYFGSFYLKDAPAVGNPGYSIGTNITADMGDAFVAALTPVQAELVTGLVDLQRPHLNSIVSLREQVAIELRRCLTGGTPDSTLVLGLMGTYGEEDGAIVHAMATHFAQVGQTLTQAQQDTLMVLRHETLGDFTPTAAFLYSTPIDFPVVRNTDFLFE
jgi:hypothetical protein